MKRVFTLLLAMAAFSGLHAQIRIGVKGGLNASNQSFRLQKNGHTSNETSDPVFGYQLGMISDIPFSKSIHFRPEFILSGKGSNLNDLTQGATLEIRPVYLEVPMNVVYYIHGRKVNYFIGAGPSIAVGVFGKIREDGLEADAFTTSQPMERVEIGLSATAGIDLAGGFTAGLTFNKGLTNAWDVNLNYLNQQPNLQFRNINIGITVGYFFRKKK